MMKKNEILETAANYTTYRGFRRQNPETFQAAMKMGLSKTIFNLFENGGIADYKVEEETPDLRLKENREHPYINKRMIHQKAKEMVSLGRFKMWRKAYWEAAQRLGMEDALTAFFDRSFFEDEVRDEAREFPDFTEFELHRPRYAREAERLGIADDLEFA